MGISPIAVFEISACLIMIYKQRIRFPFLLALLFCTNLFAQNKRSGDDAQLLVTTNDRSIELKKIMVKSSATTATIKINLDRSVRFQEMDGFGEAITGSTCYNLLHMNKKDRLRFLKETFDPIQGYGHSYVRMSIGCSDFSLSEYTCCDKEGIENFALQDEEKNYVIPVLKEILKINPAVKILGSPWTCPRWMKVNNLSELQPFNSWTSGQLNPKYYSDYAVYFSKWINAFAKEGIKIYAVTLQNEPLNRKNSASLFMGWEEERDFVKVLGAQFAAEKIGTKIYVFDHNYNYDNMPDQKGYPLHIYQDSVAAQYIAGAAYHNYGGNRKELRYIHTARPDKELLFTETSIGTWNHGRDLSNRLLEDMEDVGLGTVNNWCKGAMVWNLMLDSDKGPWRDGGCKTCYGAVDIDRKDYKSISKNSHYYVISHLAAVVKPGAVRIGTNGNTQDGIIYAGFENKDGSLAVVLLNKTDQQKEITVADGKRQYSYAVPAKSVVSYRWK